MFVGMSGANLSEVPFRYSILGDVPGFYNTNIRLLGPARDKRSSLLRKLVKYGRNFFVFVPGNVGTADFW